MKQAARAAVLVSGALLVGPAAVALVKQAESDWITVAGEEAQAASFGSCALRSGASDGSASSG